MDFFEVVEKRGTYRLDFKEQQIPDEDIIKIVNAGLLAPSGHNFQTTSFVIVKNKELRDKISTLMPTKATKTAPVILVALSEKKMYKVNETAHFYFDTEDYAAAVENILFAITAMGYAAVWMDGMSRMDENYKEIAKILNVPSDRTVRTIIPFGVPVNEVKQNSRKPFEERVVWNRF